ncbi:hypothetical protein BJ165DRAFT_1073421 [Panaeolus papilionaceus]|nr:hypothetical protein BJ165DRAFT_1073421 [Panaeolus papilionaceus]
MSTSFTLVMSHFTFTCSFFFLSATPLSSLVLSINTQLSFHTSSIDPFPLHIHPALSPKSMPQSWILFVLSISSPTLIFVADMLSFAYTPFRRWFPLFNLCFPSHHIISPTSGHCLLAPFPVSNPSIHCFQLHI